MTTGHATDDELKAIARIKREYAASGDVERAIDLAQLYLDPLHDEELAGSILTDVLARDPKNERARFWMTYYKIHGEYTDEAVLEGRELARKLRSAVFPWNAAALLLVDAEEWLSVDGDPVVRAALLQQSVELAPDWVANRRALSAYLARLGRRREAIEHLEAAIVNLANASPPLDVVDEYFHVDVTGLVEDRATLLEELRDLKEHP
ncbi:tetratricopeptide repeat protein [Modestobacter roseus]|uniref:tetratricopeptide repeat protein n=1 Tax=Modestobacter roseus TaxID=1181884 RepID=UPI0034E0287A